MDEPNLEETQKKTKGKKEDLAKVLEDKIVDLENQLKRAVADYRNLEKRVEDEKFETIKFANRELLIRIIPAFDTLFLAEKYVADEGIKLTIKHLAESLKSVGVERVNTANADYNAETMEVVTTGDGEDNKVLEELRPGFLLNGKTIRPAQVIVGKKDNSN